MPDGINLATMTEERPSPLEIEAKAHRVYALIAAARELAKENATYEYAPGVREDIEGWLIDMACEEAEQLAEMTF